MLVIIPAHVMLTHLWELRVAPGWGRGEEASVMVHTMQCDITLAGSRHRDASHS